MLIKADAFTWLFIYGASFRGSLKFTGKDRKWQVDPARYLARQAHLCIVIKKRRKKRKRKSVKKSYEIIYLELGCKGRRRVREGKIENWNSLPGRIF